MSKLMEAGNIVEYIDRQKIICAVVLEVKKQRVRLLAENDREIILSPNRLSHVCNSRLDLSKSKNKLVEALNEIIQRRTALISQIDLKELWDVLRTEQEWIDLSMMTALCFPDKPNCDHESAVIRAFFKNRLYFKFKPDKFFPNSEDEVERISARARESARKNQLIEEGSQWLKSVFHGTKPCLPDDKMEIVEMIQSFYLFEKESKHYAPCKTMFDKAGIDDSEAVLKILIKLGVWDPNENVDLLRMKIPTSFPAEVLESATELIGSPLLISASNRRENLTSLRLMTIDGQSTLDFDDALSIETVGDHYRLGIHIADVGHFIKKGDVFDEEAFLRGSSIYMPDRKIPMLPPCLAEDLCSLRAEKLRPAISVMVNLSRTADIIDYEIFPSLICVSDQLTYYDVNMIADHEKEIGILVGIAENFRRKRLFQGAVHISLPEINIWVDEKGNPAISRINRESPGRMLISEIMIMANWLMAGFLAKHEVPAVFRSQPEPRERLYPENEGTLFQNWMQRKLLNRFALTHQPESHSGLGLDAYVTATSPIRKYFDLATQRQIRAILGLENPYTADEIRRLIQMLDLPMSCVSKIQFNRHRYWLLKYLEGKIGQKEVALVLSRRRNGYQVLLTEYMLECCLPLNGVSLKPEDLVQVTIQNVNARKDIVSVYMG